MTCGDFFLALIAILFPPIAVWIKVGLCTADSFINIGLCCLGYVPGLIHAWYIIARNPDPMDEYEPIHDSERADGQVTYYYISHEQPRQYGSNAPANEPVAAGRPAPPLPTGAAAGASAAGASAAGASATGPSSGDDAAPPPSYSETGVSNNLGLQED